MDAFSTDEATPEPKLPQELERIIFELAALSHPNGIPTLLRTAWRVKEWVEPLLYRVVFSSSCIADSIRRMDAFAVVPVTVLLNKIRNSSPSFTNSAVRCIFLDGASLLDPSTFNTIIGACPRVWNLFLYAVAIPEHAAALDTLQCLHRLTVDLEQLCRTGAIQFTRPLFHNLTHLEILDCSSPRLSFDLCTGLAFMPHLTHIAFNSTYRWRNPDMSFIHAWHQIVQPNTRLQFLVFLMPSLAPLNLVDMAQPNPEDIRVVCITQTDFRLDWLRSAAGGDDYWTLAEAFVAAKRAGRVAQSLYCISDNDQSWRT
ncbi:hypothetical protein B0H19DRAFT_1262391 [Mycena capillaripes]|nr:hypothetical protein B0H19DRAFT_1262391 [Mycena capillaripes]